MARASKEERIIDLSLTIDPSATHVGFPSKEVHGVEHPPVKIRPMTTIDKEGWLSYVFEMSTQAFTHLDVPKHFFEDRLANDEVPLETLVGEAVIIDMNHKKPGESISAKDLEESGVRVEKGDILIIRTGWTDRAFGTPEFWRRQIGMTIDACHWVVKSGVKALATDFYTGIPPIREDEHGKLVPVERPKWRCHHIMLDAGIILIDFVCNLNAIKKPRVKLIALPIKLKGTDGAPARVIAIEED